MKAIINARIYDFNKYIDFGYILFDKDIVECGPMENFKKDKNLKIIDANRDLIIPSFVCGHAHVYSIFARGLALPFNPKNFQEILDQMWWKIDKQIDNEISYFSGVAAGYEFLLNGVTTVIDHHASGDDIVGSLHALKKGLTNVAHVRGIYCFETSDRYSIKDCIIENSKPGISDNEHSSTLFGMHASMSLSDETLKLIKKNMGDKPIHCHVAESKMDEEDSLNKYGKSIIERFDSFDLLKKDSLIVHGVALNDKELDIISKRGAYLVVNTTSNMNNAVGIPNVKKYLEHNIPVFVGNDGLNSNMASEWMNVLYTSHLLNQSPKELNIGDVEKMINNSYDYAGRRLGVKLGKFENGYKADFLRVPYKPFTDMNSSNAFGHIFYGLFPSFKPMDVYIDGEIEVSNYKVVNKELLIEFNKCKKYADKLWTKVKEEK